MRRRLAAAQQNLCVGWAGSARLTRPANMTPVLSASGMTPQLADAAIACDPLGGGQRLPGRLLPARMARADRERHGQGDGGQEDTHGGDVAGDPARETRQQVRVADQQEHHHGEKQPGRENPRLDPGGPGVDEEIDDINAPNPTMTASGPSSRR